MIESDRAFQGEGLKGRLTANASVQAAGVVVGSLVSLITFATIARDLGPGSLGDFAAATAYLAIPTVFADWGLSLAVVRDISRDPARTEHAVRGSLPLRAVVALVIVAVALALAFVLPFTADMRSAIAIGSLGSALTMLGGAMIPVLQAELRMGWSVLANLTGRLVTLACAAGSVVLGLGLTGAAWAYVIGGGATAAVLFAAVARRQSVRPLVDRRYWAHLGRQGGLLGAATGLRQVVWRIDSVVLAVFRASREVGLYAAAYKFIDFTGAFLQVVSNSAFPSMARFSAERDPRLPTLMRKTLDVLLVLSAPAAILGFFMAPELVVLAAGEEFRGGAVALQILAIVPMAAATSGLLERGLIAAGRERSLLWINGVALSLNVGLNVALIPAFGFRAAAAVTLSTEVAWILLGGLMFRRTLGFLPWPRCLLSAGAASLLMVGVLVLVPLPAYAAAAVGLAAYAAVVLVVPGTIRDLAGSVISEARVPSRQP